MYAAYFGLKENPFNLTPDPRYFFFSRRHREALNHLLYGIKERKGFIVLTGGVGTGKTTVCRALLANLDKSVDSALIFNSFVSDIELLETIGKEFHLSPSEQSSGKKKYIDALNEFLLENFTSGRNAVLLIDEAQNLSYGAMEQIRMLSNLETDREKLIQIVLVGQPELNDILASPSLKQLNDRITVKYDLQPLAEKESRDYIEHRLSVAGGNGNLKFSNGAHRLIHNSSRGNPRRINAICDRALLIAYAEDTSVIDAGTVKRAVVDIRGFPSPQKNRDRKIAMMIAIVCLIALAGLFLLYRNQVVEFVANLRTYLT